MKKILSQLLLKITAWFDPWLIAVFPQETEGENFRVDLLVRAKVDAWYRKNSAITKEELEYLAERVGGLANEICWDKLMDQRRTVTDESATLCRGALFLPGYMRGGSIARPKWCGLW